MIRFSGWIVPPRDGWSVVLGDPGDRVVADGRRDVIEVAELLAERVPGPVLAVRVRRDRQLALVAWKAGEEVARYCSDPSQEPGADEDARRAGRCRVAGTFADLWDRPDAVEELAELLEDELDPDSVYESERLGRVLRLLGLPAWLVAAGELPHAMSTGPRSAELIRMRAGRTGVTGVIAGTFVRPVRRRQQPPPVIADPSEGRRHGVRGSGRSAGRRCALVRVRLAPPRRRQSRSVTHHLTRDQARRLIVRAQLLDAARPGDVVEVAEQLCEIKIDPTATIAPCEHTVLWSRIGWSYEPGQLRRRWRSIGCCSSSAELSGR